MGLEAVINWIISIWRFITPCHWIAPWEGGVRLTYPKWMRWAFFNTPEVKELQSGIHLKVPGLQRIHQTVTASQPLNLPPQSLTTKDGKKINVGGVVMYNIKSPLWFFTRIHDQDQYLRDAALGAVEEAVADSCLTDCLTAPGPVRADVLSRIRGNVRGKGYEIESFRFSDRQEGKSLRIMFGDGFDPYSGA